MLRGSVDEPRLELSEFCAIVTAPMRFVMKVTPTETKSVTPPSCATSLSASNLTNTDGPV